MSYHTEWRSDAWQLYNPAVDGLADKHLSSDYISTQDQ